MAANKSKMENSIFAKIQSELSSVERSQDIAILFAVESGSRAWGFPSIDSDYDVRFVYLHRPDWYLSIDLEKRRDSIELPIKESLDIAGWDLRKALKLFYKSNPPLLEWLQCPIVYREQHSLARKLRELLPAFYSPQANFHHYLHMARGNIREYLQGDVVWQKKYFYVLRPLLAMLWIERGLGPVPIEFHRLVDALVDDAVLRSAIDQLLDAKKKGAELDRGLKIAAISQFIAHEMSRLECQTDHQKSSAPPISKLNELFLDTLREAWGNEWPQNKANDD
jgi:uncharacterized protein